MAGGFSASGLITGIDSASLIRQLIQFERLPLIRIEDRIKLLEAQKEGIGELKSQLFSLRNLVQDFRFDTVFSAFRADSSDTSILSASATGPNPASGSFLIDVQQVATATVANSSASVGAPIDPNISLVASGIRIPVVNGSFTINGVAFGVDPNLQSLSQVLSAITASAAGVTATFDTLTDTVTFTNSTPGDNNIINFGSSSDTGNFLDAINVVGSPQLTGGSGSTEVTSSTRLAAIDPSLVLNTINFSAGPVTAGSFQINGVTINVDPTVDTLFDLISRINDSDAGVTASFNQSTNTVRVVSDTLGSRTISFVSGTSNFLDVTNLTTAIQTAGNDAIFTVDGGPVITRNSNQISNVITDITLNLLKAGTTTLSVASDTDSILEKVREFITEFNESIASIRELIAEDGDLRSDATIRGVENRLRSIIFGQVGGLSGVFDSLGIIGISTGEGFDPSAPFQLELDEAVFKSALATDRENVEQIFSNNADNGITDQLFSVLNEVTGSFGFLNERSRSNGSIDRQIKNLNNRIEAMERRIAVKEQRLRAQFASLERIISSLQTQSLALAGLSGGFQSVQQF